MDKLVQWLQIPAVSYSGKLLASSEASPGLSQGGRAYASCLTSRRAKLLVSKTMKRAA